MLMTLRREKIFSCGTNVTEGLHNNVISLNALLFIFGSVLRAALAQSEISLLALARFLIFRAQQQQAAELNCWVKTINENNKGP